jgi:hypothetical protein
MPLERVGRDADRPDVQRCGDAHHRHAHRRERPQHALHVAAFEVDARPGAGGHRQREQRRDRPGLEQPQRAVAVEGELDVLRRPGALLQPLARFAQPIELSRVQAALDAPCRPPVEHVVVGGDAPVDDDVPEARDGVDDHLGARTGDRVGREQHPGGGRLDHPLDDDGHPHRRVAEAARLPVRHRALAPERVPAPAHRVDQRVGAADVQDRLVLAREAGVRQVLGGGAGPDGDRARTEPLVGVHDLPAQVAFELSGRGGDAEPVGDPLTRVDHLGEPGGLATDECDAGRVDLGERDQRDGAR